MIKLYFGWSKNAEGNIQAMFRNSFLVFYKNFWTNLVQSWISILVYANPAARSRARTTFKSLITFYTHYYGHFQRHTKSIQLVSVQGQVFENPDSQYSPPAPSWPVAKNLYNYIKEVSNLTTLISCEEKNIPNSFINSY